MVWAKKRSSLWSGKDEKMSEKTSSNALIRSWAKELAKKLRTGV